MINTWEELRTREVRNFISPLIPEGMTEDEEAEWWDGFESDYYGIEVNVYRYELEQERRRRTLAAAKPLTRFIYRDRINTWAELVTRKPHSFMEPDWDAVAKMDEDRRASYLDKLLSHNYLENVWIHRYNLVQKREDEASNQRRMAYLMEQEEKTPSLVKRIKNWFRKKR